MWSTMRLFSVFAVCALALVGVVHGARFEAPSQPNSGSQQVLYRAVQTQNELIQALDQGYANVDREHLSLLSAVMTSKAELYESNALEAAMQRRIEAEADERTANMTASLRACPSLPKRPVPSTIKDLRADDIEMMMAMGDSITAAFAGDFRNILDGIQEYRGMSWSIGSDEEYHTLFSLFQHYNPAVSGGSTGHAAPVSGAIAEDMPDQADYLISEVQKYTGWDHKWKVLTILIGGNNLCDACKGDERDTPTLYEANLRAALDKLEKSIPRLFVNLVPMTNVSLLYDLSHGDLYCDILHKFECPCAAGSEKDREVIDNINAEYFKIVEKLAEEYQGHGRDDFTVVMQPAIAHGSLPDRGWLTKLDCFHPARQTHECMANALWKNMFETKAAKTQTLECPQEVFCPTEHDRLRVD